MKEMFLDLAKYRIQRAFENKGDAEILLRSEKVNDSVNRIYQANYYAVKSLLALKMKDSSKNQIVLQMFSENFLTNGSVPREYGEIFERSYRMRGEGDHRAEVRLERRDAETLLRDCEKFLCFVRDYLKQIILANPRKAGENLDEREECGGGGGGAARDGLEAGRPIGCGRVVSRTGGSGMSMSRPSRASVAESSSSR